MQAIVDKVLRRRKETGAENAVRFCKVVGNKAKEGRFIQLSPHDWPWMYNDAWRERVLHILEENETPVRDARFTPPDDLDGWLFDARSTVKRLRVQTLTLNDTL